MNTLVQELAHVCREHRLREKWLVAPSRRVGHQWLDHLALGGQSAVNVHIKSLRSMTVDLAAPAMLQQQVTLATPQQARFLTERVLGELPPQRLTYLASARASRGLAETLLASIEAVRLAGLDACHLQADRLEVPAKVADLNLIARAYLEALAGEHLIDYPAALELAIARLKQQPDGPGPQALVLLPADLRPGALEQQFLDALPPECRQTLPVDQPAAADEPRSADSDLQCLRWLATPADAPDPPGDRSAELVRAVGEVNEVRAVLRHCLTDPVRLDQVELLHTDAETYVPLVYQCLAGLPRSSPEPGGELPVTFAEGIPTRFSRPGQALVAWIAWIRADFPQAALVKMIREGLLQLPESDGEHSGITRLAALFRGVRIGLGRARYLPKINDQINRWQSQLARLLETGEEDAEGRIQGVARLQYDLRDLRVIQRLVTGLLQATPEVRASAREILAAARGLLETGAGRASQLDQFSATALIAEIQSLETWSTGQERDAGVDIWQWLTELPPQVRVLGSGPRPGKLHVDNLYAGGHTGRRQTFVVGLDDGRFPGAGLQDPILLDGERRRLSADLPTAAGRLEEAGENFPRLLARLRGRVRLSFSCQAVLEDREMFPSPALLSAFRVLSGRADADQGDLLAALPPPASFAPATEEQALDPGQWWLWRLCGPANVDQPDTLVEQHFPHLAQGRRAEQERQSDRLTVYDGCVPEAGTQLDPTRENGRVVSASGLQTLGTCPLRFFYRYGLQIELPEQVVLHPTQWLDPLAFGSLLHELFEQFMRQLLEQERLPKFARDHDLLQQLLDRKVAEYADHYPPPNQVALQMQLRDLRQAGDTFLREEERFCREHSSRPVYLEASLGLPAGTHTTPLDTSDPIPVALPNGQRIFTRGRIDRIDRIAGGAIETYAVWDYKTGSTYGYDPADPFRQGRLIQPLLYVSIVTHRLQATVSEDARLANFGFFFPGRQAAGQRVSWPATELRAGLHVLEKLCQIIQSGAFLPTNDVDDCRFCDYQAVCGDVEAVTAASQRKLDQAAHHPLKELRRDD